MAMIFSALKRHFREGFRSIFRNGWMTVASAGAVTMTLILVGVFLALILNLNEIANKIESDVEIKVLIDRTADEEEIKELGVEIESIKAIDSMFFASKDDELKDLIKSMGDEGNSWSLFEQDNPLNHAYLVRANEPEAIEGIAAEIEVLPGVEEINYAEEVMERLFEFNNYARTICVLCIVGLIFISIFLISNTIKITIRARSTQIGIMKLVGATNQCIRWPFFLEGMWLG